MNPSLLPKVRSKLIMSAPRDHAIPCTLRIASFAPGLSCAPQETNVMAHLPIWGKGVGTKVTDLATVCTCAVCHDLLDGRDKRGLVMRDKFPSLVLERMLHALTETHAHLVRAGIISVSDGRII